MDARRDWGYTKDYVKAMWLRLQRPEAYGDVRSPIYETVPLKPVNQYGVSEAATDLLDLVADTNKLTRS